MNTLFVWILLGLIALIVYVMIPRNCTESFTDYPQEVEQLMEIVRNTPDIKKPVEKPEPLTPEMENLLKVLKAAGRDIPTDGPGSTKSQPAAADAKGPDVSPAEQQGQIARNTVSAPVSHPAQVVVVPVQLKSSDVSPATMRQQIKDEIRSEIKQASTSNISNPNIPQFNQCPPPLPLPKPVCPPPKPVCPPPKPTCPPKPPKCKCPPMPDMSDYIRKDSIPCWACKL